MKSKNIRRQVLATILTIAGLMSWNMFSIQPSGFAANNPSFTKPTDRLASGNFNDGKIAFMRYQGNNPEIYTVNPDGSELRVLTSGAEPAWSPDGTQIAFAKLDSFGYGSIFVMDADGSNQRELAKSIFNSRNARSPSWSPDGTKIAFSNSLFPEGGFYVMNSDGSDPRRIGNFAFTKSSWSPDGSKLAVTGNDFAIDLITATGGDSMPVTAPPKFEAEDHEPAWSPDGSKIAFARWSDCDFADCYSSDVWIVNADGTNPRALTTDKGSGSPAWSPDGTKIIFSADGDLFVMNADGSGVTNITNTKDVNEFAPSWQPLLLTCTDSVSPADQSFDSDGGTGFVDVAAPSDCSWTAISHAGWVVVASASSSGNGSIAFSVAANSSTGSRTATLIVAGRKVNITQSGVPVRIASASVSGKRLFVSGENFDSGAVILINGEEQITKNDGDNPKTVLIGKKAGKKIQPGDKLQVRNPNGSRSQEITFTGAEWDYHYTASITRTDGWIEPPSSVRL